MLSQLGFDLSYQGKMSETYQLLLLPEHRQFQEAFWPLIQVRFRAKTRVSIWVGQGWSETLSHFESESVESESHPYPSLSLISTLSLSLTLMLTLTPTLTNDDLNPDLAKVHRRLQPKCLSMTKCWEEPICSCQTLNLEVLLSGATYSWTGSDT